MTARRRLPVRSLAPADRAGPAVFGSVDGGVRAGRVGSPGHVRTPADAGPKGAVSPSPAPPLVHSADAGALGDAGDLADVRSLWAALGDVLDPELPISIVDLGLVQAVRARGGVVQVELTYTATGCPCMEFIHEDVRARLLREPGVIEVRIRDVWDPPWTSDRISPAGRAMLRRHGVGS